MFELTIKCSKDIDELRINFADGTSSYVSNDSDHSQNGSDDRRETPELKKDTKRTKETSDESSRSSRKGIHEGFLDTDEEFGNISYDVVELPKIERNDESVNVADELQNFDF